jgi:hypothetical protein
MKDLFGKDIPDYPLDQQRGESWYHSMKRTMGYRQTTAKEKCCKFCKQKRTFDYHNKNYHKCMLIGISHSEATDIRLRNVCDRFERIA